MNAAPGGAAPRRAAAPRSGGRTTARRDSRITDQEAGARVAGTSALAPGRSTAPRRSARPWLTAAPPAPVAVPRAPFIALLLLVVVGGVVGILMVNTRVMENAFQLQNLQQEHARLDREEMELRSVNDANESPNNLYRAARELGLVDGQPAVIALPNGKRIDLPRPAADPASAGGAGASAATSPGAGALPAARTAPAAGAPSAKQDITTSNEPPAGR